MEPNDKRVILSRSTSDPLLNELLQKLLWQIQYIIKQQFMGMYIGGSIANNSFNENPVILTVMLLQQRCFLKMLFVRLR